MTGQPRTSTNPHVIRSHELKDQRAALMAERLANPPASTRRCPVCGEPPGPGWHSYCGVDHLFARRGSS